MSISTIQWKGDNIIDIYAFMLPDGEPEYMGKRFTNADEIIGVWTSMGLRVAHLGDWITKLEDGSFRVDQRALEQKER